MQQRRIEEDLQAIYRWDPGIYGLRRRVFREGTL
jgi:hypothetical protein